MESGKRVNPREVESQGEAKSQSVFPSLVSQRYQEVPPQVSLQACFSYSRMRQAWTICMIWGALLALTSTLGVPAALGVGKRCLHMVKAQEVPGVGMGGTNGEGTGQGCQWDEVMSRL